VQLIEEQSVCQSLMMQCEWVGLVMQATHAVCHGAACEQFNAETGMICLRPFPRQTAKQQAGAVLAGA
jgi:hypothetical protein